MLVLTCTTHYAYYMSEILPESEGQLEKLGLQKTWDLAAELINAHGISDEDYGIMSVTWTYSGSDESLFVEDVPGLNTYGGSKISPELSIGLGKPTRDRFEAHTWLSFNAGEAGRKIYGELKPENIEQILVTDAINRQNPDRIPTPTEIAEVELLLSFALADLNDQKRRKVAQENLRKVALQSNRLKARNGKLEHIDTWLASVIEEYDPKD